MKYNIVTVTNESYFPFFEIWIKSLFDNLELSSVAKIYIIDTGMSDANRKFINLFPKTKIWKTDIKSVFDQIHSEAWGKSNYAKLPVIKEILLTDKSPTYFIDVDCVFVHDYYSVLDFTKDIVLTDTSDRKIFCNSQLIGCFYGFNNVHKAIKFIDQWYENILNGEKYSQAWKESPALTDCANAFRHDYEYQILKESKICSSMFSPAADVEPFIIHMKSEGAYGFKTVRQRLQMPHAQKYTMRYGNV